MDLKTSLDNGIITQEDNDSITAADTKIRRHYRTMMRSHHGSIESASFVDVDAVIHDFKVEQTEGNEDCAGTLHMNVPATVLVVQIVGCQCAVVINNNTARSREVHRTLASRIHLAIGVNMLRESQQCRKDQEEDIGYYRLRHAGTRIIGL